MIFEWDPKKAASNARKHRVSFEEATTVFADVLSLTIPDPDHSLNEERWILLGRSHRNRLIVVAHAIWHERIRIISARVATRHERLAYEEEGNKS